jgi:Ca-activated chloride channel family protein
VHWTVAKADKPDAVLKSVKNRELSVDLDPGSYVVEARFGQASARQTLEVASDKPTAARLSLAAGLLKIKAHADKAGAPLTNPLVTISVKTADGSQRPFWVGRAADTEMVVPAGQYIVRVQDGLAEQTTEVTLTEGAGADVTPVLGTGRLELSAVAAANGQPLTDVIYLIEEDDPDARKGRREVARSADPAAAFTLPAGTYYVVARQGVAETRDRIALGTGDVVKHVATFSLVQLTVTANAGGGADQPVLIRILSEDQTHREIARANGMTGTFLLPPARYRVEATVSGLNIKALGTVDISNGRGGGVQLTLESGEVAVGASAAQGRHWRIKDASGRTVLHSGPGEATSARLAPGRYVLLTDGGERRTEQAFDLKTGERRELSLGSP